MSNQTKNTRCRNKKQCDECCPLLIEGVTKEQYEEAIKEYSKFIAMAILNEFEREQQEEKQSKSSLKPLSDQVS